MTIQVKRRLKSVKDPVLNKKKAGMGRKQTMTAADKKAARLARKRRFESLSAADQKFERERAKFLREQRESLSKVMPVLESLSKARRPSKVQQDLAKIRAKYAKLWVKDKRAIRKEKEKEIIIAKKRLVGKPSESMKKLKSIKREYSINGPVLKEARKDLLARYNKERVAKGGKPVKTMPVVPKTTVRKSPAKPKPTKPFSRNDVDWSRPKSRSGW